MFSASRIVAIDDDKDYLDKLTGSLHGMGIPCIPICYPDSLPPEGSDWFHSFRIVFCDLHLLGGAANPDLNYPIIGGLLERFAAHGSGPVLLILWTAYPEDADRLRAYLSARHADAEPIAVLALRKADFDGNNGNLLPDAIREKLSAIPQLHSLYEWQDDVAMAAGACVGTLLRLARKSGGELSEALDVLLSQLAIAAGGSKLAKSKPGAAVQEALLPLLADKIGHLPANADRDQRWVAAMPSAVAGKRIPSNEDYRNAVNTALSIQHSSDISARERGAVVEVVCPSLFLYRFGQAPGEIINKYALKNPKTNYRWVGIQVEAACDFAQQKSPCIPYVLAIEIPAAEEVKQDRSSGRPDSLWESPVFTSESGESVRLVANVRYVSMVSAKKANTRKAVYRLRDPIVNELAYVKSRHELRPGIVQIP